jgi:hypothetical protein
MANKPPIVDLHTHSTASDGTSTPTELIERAAEIGLKAISLTDHDTTAGLAEASAAADRLGIEFVPGIEISAEFSPGTMHILGYLFDPDSPAIQAVSEKYIEGRDGRNAKMVARLQEFGCRITIEEVEGRAGGDVVGRPHMAEIMIESGFVRNKQEAFNKYLAKGESAYFDRYRLPQSEAIGAIHAAGGLASLAHPIQLKAQNSAERERIIRSLADDGLDGVEAYHSQHRNEDVREYLDLASRLGLCVTGGSDFHGSRKANVALGTGAGNVRAPYSLLEELRKRHALRHGRRVEAN